MIDSSLFWRRKISRIDPLRGHARSQVLPPCELQGQLAA